MTASSTTVDGTNSVTLTAAVTNDKNSAGVSWTVSGGGTLSNSTTTSATYTAPAATSSAQTITVTATSVADSTKTGTATITVAAKPTITTAGTGLAATVGAAYSVQLTGSGGISPYTWTVASGTLPPCLSMSTGGLITGTVTAACAGTYSPVFTMTDSGTPTKLTATVTLNMTIAAAPAITFTGAMPATATYKVAYAGSAAAGGGAGALTYSLAGGALPAGVALNASTGAVAGTPTAAGTFNFTVKAADTYGDSNTHAYSIVVSYPAMSITTGTTLATGYVGSNYTTTTLAATGGTGVAANYTWAVTGGSLPAGLTLSPAGAISGKPSGTAGTSTFTVTVTDTVASVSGSNTFTIVVDAGVSITTATTLPVGYAGSNYSQTLAATGGSGTGYSWAVSGGSTLPAGLSLSAAGVLSGKPTAAGASTFSLTVTDSVGNTASATFSLTIDAGITINAITLPKGYEGAAYPGATFTATGGTNTGYTWSATGLPAGLIITAGAISGTPTAAGTFSIVATVTDSVGNTASTTVSLVVEATLSITTTSPLHGGTVGVAYSQQLAATGGSGTGYTWSTDGPGTSSLAAVGLSLSGAGVVSGTTPILGSATFTATVTDSETHTVSAIFSVTVTNALAISTTTLPATNVGTSYSQTLNAGGGTGTGYTWTTTSSNLSTYGLSLSSAGVVSGTPTQAGTASFTAKVTDSGSNTTTQALTITIYNALTLPTPSSTVPGPGTTGGSYGESITATGGSGGYSWTVTGLPADGLSYSAVGGTLNITGTPSTATTVSFTAQVTDTATSVHASNTYSIVVSNPATLTLPAPSPQPSSLPAATVNQAYVGSISASGGASPYTWTVNATAVPTNGTPVALTNGLSVTNTGSSMLSVGGTPTTTTPVSIAATVKDNVGTATSNTYTVTVNSAGSQVAGIVDLNDPCFSGSLNLPTFSLTISGSGFNQTVSTDSNQNFLFTGVPNGTYTITPSYSAPSGTSVAFYPATQSVTVNNSNITNLTFGVALGYTVSGTASYSGTHTGQIYLNLVNTGCGGNGGQGTSISSAGPFTIHGVPPGSYTLQAWMDPNDSTRDGYNLGEEIQNIADPTGNSSVSVSSSNFTGANVSLADATSLSVGTTGPKVKGITPMDNGAIISFKGSSVTDSNGMELYTSYTIQWSTSNTTFSSANQAVFKAVGGGSNVWIVHNGIAGMSGSIANGQSLYFQVKGTNAAGTSSPWTVSSSTVTIGQPTTGNTVTGTITIPSSVTITPGAVLYAGLYNQSSNSAYAMVIPTPSNSTGNNFSVNVPTGTGYILFGILDQNNDGLIDAGDDTNTRGNSTSINVSGNLSSQNATLPSGNSAATVATLYTQNTYSSGTFSGYSLLFKVQAVNKLPVAVTLTSGPNVLNPVDITNYCPNCGELQYLYIPSINGSTPNVGDAYVFNVKYSDGKSENVTSNVTGWNGGSTVAGASDLASNLAPSANNSTSLTPTFTWTDSTNSTASTDYYQFQMQGGGNTIWQIPGQNSNSSGFGSSITSITWGTDPTGDTTNTPSVSSLTSGTTYNWSIAVTDSNGNQAQTWMWYQP